MAYFLRVVRQARWYKYPELDWLPDGGLQADALGDLQTTGNELSVYRVENEMDRDRVIVALAANRDNLANLDYAVFDDAGLVSIGVAISQQDGQTPDLAVNRLHYNLVNLTAENLVQIAQAISSGEHVRISRKDIELKLRRSIESGELDRGRIKSPRLLGQIEQVG